MLKILPPIGFIEAPPSITRIKMVIMIITNVNGIPHKAPVYISCLKSGLPEEDFNSNEKPEIMTIIETGNKLMLKSIPIETVPNMIIKHKKKITNAPPIMMADSIMALSEDFFKGFFDVR